MTIFVRATNTLTRAGGSPRGVVLAVAVVIGWALWGPIAHGSAVWQSIIDTISAIVTFLLAFLLLATQNRDTAAMQAKLDALVAATPGADDALTRVEELPESEIEQLRR